MSLFSGGYSGMSYSQAERLVSAVERLTRALESFEQRNEPPPKPETINPIELTSRIPEGEIEL